MLLLFFIFLILVMCMTAYPPLTRIFSIRCWIDPYRTSVAYYRSNLESFSLVLYHLFELVWFKGMARIWNLSRSSPRNLAAFLPTCNVFKPNVRQKQTSSHFPCNGLLQSRINLFFAAFCRFENPNKNESLLNVLVGLPVLTSEILRTVPEYTVLLAQNWCIP